MGSTRVRSTALAAISAILLGLAGSAGAGDTWDPVERCQYLLVVGRTTEAAASAADLLEKDPNDLEAHRLYHEAWASLGDRYHLIAQYRSWYEKNPEDESARVALAQCLWLLRRYVDGAEAEISQLLDPLPEDARARFHALQVQGRVAEMGALAAGGEFVKVEVAEEERTRAMIAAAEASGIPRLERRAILMRLFVDPIDRDLAKQVRQAVGVQPSLMQDLVWALWIPEPSGPHARALRRFAKKEAYSALAGNDPLILMNYSCIFHQADDDKAQRACDRRVQELEPSYDPYDPDDPVYAIYAAQRRYNPEVGLEDLERLDEDVPESGPLRADFEDTRGGLLFLLDRLEEAHAAHLRAMEAGPEDEFPAIAFAYSAMRTDLDRELALDYLRAELEELGSGDYTQDDFWVVMGLGGWTELYNKRTARLLNAEAAVLHDLGRTDEAVAPLLRACALADRHQDHDRLGDVYDELGRPVIAFEHRLRAAALLVERFPTHFDETGLPDDLRAGWESRPYWHPDGLEGFVADRAVALGKENRKAQRPTSDNHPIGDNHPLFGQPFPDLAYTVGDDEHHLSDHDGLLLVQFWNPG
jgi:tetratricopeptide (TPR) repeat protein